MDEAKMNNIIVKSFLLNGTFAYKIPDPRKENIMTSAKRPFDLFAVADFTYFIESKLIKQDYKAWNFNSIADHQWENLLLLNTVVKRFNLTMVRPLFVLGIWLPRKEFSLLFFEVDTVIQAREASKKSFKKKDLLNLKDQGYCSSIKKSSFDIYNLKTIPPSLKFY